MGKKYKYNLRNLERQKEQEQKMSFNQSLTKATQPVEKPEADYHIELVNPETGFTFKARNPNAITVIMGSGRQEFPPQKEIPRVPACFRSIASGLFFNGGRLSETLERVGYRQISDANKRETGRNVLAAYLGSFDVDHNHKIDAAAWVLFTISEPIAVEEATSNA